MWLYVIYMCGITQRDIFNYKLLNFKNYEEKFDLAGRYRSDADSV